MSNTEDTTVAPVKQKKPRPPYVPYVPGEMELLQRRIRKLLARDTTPEERYCSSCQRRLRLTVEHFYPDAAQPLGFDYHCKQCRAAVQKKYASTERGKETRRAASKAFRERKKVKKDGA